ncbi:MAG: nucleotide exchange factor GrpE, partial [Thermoplasmata archaeon]|nr:nucleotide exchange factor GrpE [Thermoplasmata archaeon]
MDTPEESPSPAPASAEAPAAPAEPSPAAVPSDEDWLNRYKYLLAEFDNYRKRTSRDSERARSEAQAELYRSLLAVYESFPPALAAARRLPPRDPLRQGLELLDQEWEKFMRRGGVEPVARVGEWFHPEEAEAVGEAPADPRHPDGTVAEIVQQGYRSSYGLLRTAKVIVSRVVAPPPAAAAAV